MPLGSRGEGGSSGTGWLTVRPAYGGWRPTAEPSRPNWTLTTDRVTQDGEHVLLHLGDRPVRLPAPMDALMLDLVARRGTDALIRHESDWLFPGRTAGRPLHESMLLKRLRAVGVSTRQGRSTALPALAQEVPAGLLAKMLGVHITVAVAWQRASAGDWMGYAADVAARSAAGARPGNDDAPAVSRAAPPR